MRTKSLAAAALVRTSVALATASLIAFAGDAVGQTAPAITVSSSVPAELNPPFVAGPPSTGGAPEATPEQASAFAWQEFIALTWPAGPQEGKPGQRDTPSSTCKFGDPAPECGLLVWETMRHKVEIFPGEGDPHGYPGAGSADPSYGYDDLPKYKYDSSQYKITPCRGQVEEDSPWVNLDEIDQITLDLMYAGVVDITKSSPGNLQPQLIRFLAKANRDEYTYVAKNKWWAAGTNPKGGPPNSIVMATRDYLAKNQYSPPAGSSKYVSLPYGTIEIKAGWRPLNDDELKTGKFHTQKVRFYQQTGAMSFCYRDATWGLVALHIIQKTPSAPYFIYASFEQTDNLLTEDGKPVEDADGNILPPSPRTAKTPQVCLIDPKPEPPFATQPIPDKPSTVGKVVLTDDPKTCAPNPALTGCSPGKRLYYRNEEGDIAPTDIDICVNKRDNDIPQYVIDANMKAHAAITSYLQKNGILKDGKPDAAWLHYKLVNVQYYPYDKHIAVQTPNGSLYDAPPPYTAKNPAPSSYYMANIVVETNRALQLFSGGLSPSISTDWNQDGSDHKNTYYGGSFYRMGGCMGCHGSQGQTPGRPASVQEPDDTRGAGDFSVILARGRVEAPEGPSSPQAGALAGAVAPASEVFHSRNRSLK